MYEKIKKHYRFIAAFFIVLIIFTGGWLVCRYYDLGAARDGSDATVTIQQIKDDNQSARDDIKSAGDQIGEAKRGVDRAISGINDSLQSVGKLQERTGANQREIDECRNITTESRRNITEASEIFRDIDKANKISPTQDSGY